MQNNFAEDDFWGERVKLFTAQFPAYYTKPQPVWGQFHASEEQYISDSLLDLIPPKQKKGVRTYVMMHPVVLEPVLTLTVNVYDKPKHYADQEPAIGQAVGMPKTEGIREVQVGNAQAWYYHEDRMLVLWECFFDDRFRRHPLPEDVNMRQLWSTFERWLLRRFPQTVMIATPFNDPIVEDIREYQAFLKTLGFASTSKGVFGKPIHTVKRQI
jgi:hypothetical protein